MILERLTILGGASPFVAALIDALAEDAGAPMALTLHGRNRRNLALVAAYGANRLGELGWRVAQTTDLAAALDGAEIVIHQIRYGGMAGRGRDEALAARFGLPCDETLGPAALHRALASAPALRRMSETLRARCPEAWIVNLTNPLSVTTAIMGEAGLARALGLCELPTTTARAAAAFCGAHLDEVEWDYVGLNHRGFITRLERDGVDLIAELPERMGTARLGGVGADEIACLGAVPTKYFGLLSGRYAAGPGRADILMDLQARIADELARDPTAAPPSLTTRSTDWYPEAVVPMVRALRSETPRLEVVNEEGGDGVVVERRAWVSREAIARRPARATPPAPVAAWLGVYDRHERAVLKSARRPSRGAVAEALAADPLTPEARVGEVADAIWRSLEQAAASAMEA